MPTVGGAVARSTVSIRAQSQRLMRLDTTRRWQSSGELPADGVQGRRMPSPPRRDMPASRFRDHGTRAAPVGDLGVTELKADVAKSNVPEQGRAIGSRDR